MDSFHYRFKSNLFAANFVLGEFYFCSDKMEEIYFQAKSDSIAISSPKLIIDSTINDLSYSENAQADQRSNKVLGPCLFKCYPLERHPQYGSYCMSILKCNVWVSLKRVTLKETRALKSKTVNLSLQRIHKNCGIVHMN